MNENLKGTGRLLKLFLRRDRFILPVWIILSAFAVAGQASFINAMPDWEKFLSELSANALTNAYLGPIVPLSREGAVLWRGMLQSAMIVMLGSSFTAIRHIRSEEESGRTELVIGCAVSKYAYLNSTVVMCALSSLLSGILVSAVFILNGFSAAGALLSGLTLFASGCFFAGLGILAAQCCKDAGKARGVILALYFATMLPMVINNVGGGRTIWVWIVPESWFRLTAPFGENNYGPLIVFMILSAIPTIIAYYAAKIRDLGQGILSEKHDVTKRTSNLSSPLALAWRQHKASILTWSLGMLFIGGPLGIITPDLSDNISSMLVSMSSWAETMSKLGNRTGFIAVSIYILGLMAGTSLYGILTVLKLKREETEHFAEIVLSKAVSRINWMCGYIIMAFAGSTVILLVLGLSIGLGWSLASGDLNLLLTSLAMSLSKIPSVWIIAGIAVFLYGWLPRASSFLNWVILGSFIIIEILWEAGIANWSLMKLTPFAYVHYSIPVNEISMFSLIVLVLISGVFTVLGIIGFKRRNII